MTKLKAGSTFNSFIIGKHMAQDFEQYIDLTPLDVTPAQIYLDSIEVARTVFPDFDLRVGTIEDAMFQAFAYMSALNIGSINRLPDSLFLGAVKMIGTPYKDGQRATMDVVFTANTNSGADIPAGTIVQYSLTNSDVDLKFVFETNDILTIAPNTIGDPLPTGTIECTAQVVGIIPEIASGIPLQILSYNPNIYTAVSNGNFVQGEDSESLSGYLNRGVANIASMSQAITTARQLNNFVIADNPNLVTRSKVYDLTDKDGDLLVSDPDESGHVTIFAYGPKRFLTSTEKSEILNVVSDATVAGLDIGILDPILLDLKITANIFHYSSITSSALEEELEEFLAGYFSVDFAPWREELIRRDDILALLLSNPYVRNVSTLTLSITDSGSVSEAVASDGNVEYTAVGNRLAVGDLVTVTGITPSSLDTSVATEVIERTSTKFTVANPSASGEYVSGGSYSADFPNWGAASGSDYLFSKKGSILNISKHKIDLTLNAI